VLVKLSEMLQLEILPERIEAYDISNVGSESITCGMVVYQNGKFDRSDYRSFGIRGVQGTPDDYASMEEAIGRRLRHLQTDTSGSFSKTPDLILLDGGRGHVGVVKRLLAEMGMDIPVFGMVKDDYHKTRALCNERDEINIAKERAVFTLIYRLQEEVHRFTVAGTMRAKRNTIKHSSLEKIEGIGPAKAKALLQAFGGLGGVKNADRDALCAVRGIGVKDANAILNYFGKNKKDE